MSVIASGVVARAPLLPGAGIAAYSDASEVAIFARAPLQPGADVAAYKTPMMMPLGAYVPIAILFSYASTLGDVALSAAISVVSAGGVTVAFGIASTSNVGNIYSRRRR